MTDLIYFYDNKLAHCEITSSELEEITTELNQDKKNINYLKIDIRENQDVAEKFQIEATPSVIFADKTGKEIGRISGYYPKEELRTKIKTILEKTKTD